MIYSNSHNSAQLQPGTNGRCAGPFYAQMILLDGSAGDEEPLVVYAIDWCRAQVVVRLDPDGARLNTIGGARDSHVGPAR